MSYPYHMRLWDSAQHQAAMRKLAKQRQEAVRPILEARAKAESKAVAVKQGVLWK
ncbi:MAG: hypothetical protein NUV63_05720 [Gallionella sp.]|nr:hypothetical protein [Gallionella sp.]